MIWAVIGLVVVIAVWLRVRSASARTDAEPTATPHVSGSARAFRPPGSHRGGL